MKLYNILTVSALSLILAGAAGCTKEVDYEPAVAPTGAQIFFPTTATSAFDLAEGQNSVTVDVSRLSKNGAASANIKATATVGTQATDIFNIPSSVSFADGSETAPITITFDFDNIKPETTYSISLELEGEGLSTYGKNVQNITILYAPWSNWAKMDGDCEYTNATPWGFTDNMPIFERKSLLNPNLAQYNIPDVFSDDLDFIIDLNLGDNRVTVPVQGTGVKSGDAEIQFCDSYTFFSEIASGSPDPYLGNSTFNPETGLMTINMIFFTLKSDGGIGWWGDGNYDFVQLPGYPNYSIAIANSGTFISEAGQEYAILNTVKGSDVASYAIVLKPGALTEEEISTEVDAIIANSETVLYNENRDFQFPIYEENYYTCLTVSYDAAGEAKGSDAYTFYYELNGVDWNEGWTIVAKNAEFSDVFFAGIWFSSVNTWEVEVQESNDNPGYYRIVKPYGSNPYEEPTERGHYYVYIDASNPDAVVVDPSLTSYGYYVLSAPGIVGKLVDGTKFVFPANSLGVFNGYNEDGSMNVLAAWSEEATLLDLDPQAEEPEPEAVKARKAKVQKLNATPKLYNGLLMPYTGKKIEKAIRAFNGSRR